MRCVVTDGSMLRWLTAEVIARRFGLENERNERTKRMALEIKGLKGKALKAGSVFDRLNRAYDKLIETGDAHASDVEGLAPQIEAMQDDITFAVQTLGNSVNGSGEREKPKEPLGEKQVIGQQDSGKLTIEEPKAPMRDGVLAVPHQPLRQI